MAGKSDEEKERLAAELLEKIFPLLILQQLPQKLSGKHETVCPVIQKLPDGKLNAPIVKLVPKIVEVQPIVHNLFL